MLLHLHVFGFIHSWHMTLTKRLRNRIPTWMAWWVCVISVDVVFAMLAHG